MSSFEISVSPLLNVLNDIFIYIYIYIYIIYISPNLVYLMLTCVGTSLGILIHRT
jgi:hypothetical protein